MIDEHVHELGEVESMSADKQHTYGFTYGGADVQRWYQNEKTGAVIIGIHTLKYPEGLQIYVTKTGKVRVFSENGTEWKEPAVKSS